MENYPFKIIKTWKEIKRVVQYCKDTGYCSFDFETDAQPFHSDYTFETIVGICFQPGSAYIIPLGHFDSPFKDEYKKILKYLGKHLFQNTSVVKVAWNIQFEHKRLMRLGIHLRGTCLDAMLAKYLLDEEKPNGLKDNVARFIPKYSGYDLPGSGGKKFNWAGVPLQELSKYCALDCDLTLRLQVFFETKLMELGFYKLYRNLAMQIAQVLADSSFHGFSVDREFLESLVVSYETKIQKEKDKLYGHHIIKKYERIKRKEAIKDMIKVLQSEIKDLRADTEKDNTRTIASREQKITRYIAGVFTTNKELKAISGFNFSSPDQLKDVFFRHPKGFRFPIISYTVDKKTKKETKNPSTAEDVLLQLQKRDRTGFIQALLEYRGLTKLFSTYITGMLDILSERDKIHTSFLVHGTVTGRLSSRGPNMQNIPRVTTNADIKKMFIAPPGFWILEVDYSQAELRVVAELSKDKTMVDMFQRGHNIHCATAAMAFTDMTYEEFYPLTKDESHEKHIWAVKLKKKAKTYNFGVLYGQSPKKLAETIAEATGERPDVDAAEAGLLKWFNTFPGVKTWINKQHKLAKKQGYVTNIFGRKRRLPDIYSNTFGKFLEAQRQSVNAPIQGAASDFTQFSSVIIREERLKGNLPKYFKQIYTVHDSLGFYIKPKDMHWVIPRVVEICANPQTEKWFDFKMELVNMKVSPELGVRWCDLSDYKPAKDYEKLLKEYTI